MTAEGVKILKVVERCLRDRRTSGGGAGVGDGDGDVRFDFEDWPLGGVSAFDSSSGFYLLLGFGFVFCFLRGLGPFWLVNDLLAVSIACVRTFSCSGRFSRTHKTNCSGDIVFYRFTRPTAH